MDAKKKTLLASDAPEAVAMHGSNHMDEDVGKLMEVAGTKAARRNTVMLNERRYILLLLYAVTCFFISTQRCCAIILAPCFIAVFISSSAFTGAHLWAIPPP